MYANHTKHLTENMDVPDPSNWPLGQPPYSGQEQTNFLRFYLFGNAALITFVGGMRIRIVVKWVGFALRDPQEAGKSFSFDFRMMGRRGRLRILPRCLGK